MPDLEAQIDGPCRRHLDVEDARGPPATGGWSEIVLHFISEFYFRFGGSSWKAQDALRFIGSHGGKLTTIPPDQLCYVRSQLLNAPTDDFGWLLRWLKKPKNCEPAIYNELTRTSAMREKIKALTDGTRYLSPSQKMSRANQRRRRAAERKQSGTPNSEEYGLALELTWMRGWAGGVAGPGA